MIVSRAVMTGQYKLLRFRKQCSHRDRIGVGKDGF